MLLSREEIEILSKLRDARLTGDVLIELTQIINSIIENRNK